MDTTLGKRIMHHRKRLGLTQDKLAETMGVTAQAVSKWENNQSCPDITILPRLAQLFGITTDELLGVAETPKEESTVVEGIVEETPTGKERPDFEFKWEPGRRDAIFLSVFVLLIGTLTLVNALLGMEVSFWNILWPCGILAVGVWGFLRKFSFFNVVCTLFGGYFLLENMYITDLDVSWKLIFPVLILLLGLSLLVDSFKKPNHSRWYLRNKEKSTSHLSHNGNLVNEFTVNGDTFTYALHFGDDYRQVEMKHLSKGEVDCSFGNLTLDLCSCETFADNCHLRVDCSFGSATVLVPKSAQVVPNSSTAFAGIDIQGSPNADAATTIHMDADVSFGSITLCYT